ncbi:uncharacterized protein LOC106063235 [Biomphalaria glabrata]|uniref:Uncharacterized protein LOC106063235 n=1 Tax=Biomphalaria glabrata TaxID=6526 RepID=A0A9W3BB31_BIOGL|nr:uncharacterized protein LOC106063235 [Biomphalaria glabrata]XP_055896777.1 uncharacterized protein LOC106063235 [Biomphalaria glabrata]XP_055896778.1 uncharacterized protein LOC106063235 [Biomphalaria glabrata]XP_055896779.1 uncharacterized protein LOC106063235 [Biomphalaria glabrata]
MAFSNLPTTKDVLGEHLFYKVEESLSTYFANYEVLPDGQSSPAEKITGMLLERSIKDVNHMLTDQMFLLDNIHEALVFLIEDKLSDKLLQQKSSKSLSCDELGEILYFKVRKLEGNNASCITGMLLDQDISSLVSLLQDDNLLKMAVNKAKESLNSHEPSRLADTNVVDKDNIAFQCPVSNNIDCPVCSQYDVKNCKESLGLHIFNEVIKVHPDINTASKLTGMILEMDQSSLRNIFSKKHLIQCVIDKAFKTLINSS